MRAIAALAIYVSLVSGVRGEATRQDVRLSEEKARLEEAQRQWPHDAAHQMKLMAATADLANRYRAAGHYVEAEKMLRDAMSVPAGNVELPLLVRNSLADLLR